MLHEKVNAVLLQADGVGIVFRYALDHLQILDINLVAAGRALVGADFARDDHAGLLRQAFERLKDFRRNAFDMGHALHRAGAVAKDGKQQLAALAQVIEPPAQGDRLALMLAEGRDCSDWGWACGQSCGSLFGHTRLHFPEWP